MIAIWVPEIDNMRAENELAKVVLDAAFKIHTRLGPGLLESVYEAILAYELPRLGVAVRRQVPIPIHYEGLAFEEGFRADLLVGECLIVELKSVEALAPVQGKQVLTQLKLSGHRLGLLINFGAELIQVRRVLNTPVGPSSSPRPTVLPSRDP